MIRTPERLVVVGSLFALAGAVTPSASAATRYVFTTFLGDAVADEKLSVYTSSDGLSFELLANTNYGGPTNVLRDPSILKHTDGKYYVAYTIQSWTTSSSAFGIASSTDLRSWSFLTEVPSGIGPTQFTWAPEWFVDSDGVHLIVSLEPQGSDADFRSYDFKAKDASLTAWEQPVPIGIGPNYIDTFIVKNGATYHAFSKNETTKYIEHATSAALHGPWTWVGRDDWAGWGSGKEGISLYELDGGGWRMFLDCYSGCGFLYADSVNLEDWSTAKTVPTLSGVRHGTVIREELDATGGGAGGGGTSAGGTSGTSTGGSNAGGSNRGGTSSGGTSTGGANTGGSSTGGTSTGGSGTGGSSTGGTTGGIQSSGGSPQPATGGAKATPTGGNPGAGGVSSTGGAASQTSTPSASRSTDSGCTFHPIASRSSFPLAALAAFFLASLGRSRRRR